MKEKIIFIAILILVCFFAFFYVVASRHKTEKSSIQGTITEVILLDEIGKQGQIPFIENGKIVWRDIE